MAKVKIRKKLPTAAYSSAILQNNYGESHDKGYLMWTIENNGLASHERRIIENDYGFANILIEKGEDWQFRLSNIQLSKNPKKTKVWVRWTDFEENYSAEHENIMQSYIQSKYGCESIKIEFVAIPKDLVIDDNPDAPKKGSEELLVEFVNNGEFDLSEELMQELLALHRETNKLLEIKDTDPDQVAAEWDLDKVEISNLLSFPVSPTTVDFEELRGITGIFGKNYNGKTNLLKALAFILFKEIPGDNPRYLLNIYTGANTGYGKAWIRINGERYFIHRSVKMTTKKDGSTSNSYSVEYKKLELQYDENGDLENEVYKDVDSDEATKDQTETSRLVEAALGNFSDFAVIALQTQGGGKDNYIELAQQSKNNLIGRYIGTGAYRDRYEYRKAEFNSIKNKQKDLGNVLAIEAQKSELELQKSQKQQEYENIQNEHKVAVSEKEKIDQSILIETKKLEKVDLVEISDKTIVQQRIDKNKAEGEILNKSILEKEKWLSENFKKELSVDTSVSIDDLNKKLETDRNSMKTGKESYLTLDKWLKENPTKKEKNVDGFKEKILQINKDISAFEAQLLTYSGKNCPTCGSVQKKADPEKEIECKSNIKFKKEAAAALQKDIDDNEAIKKHNTTHADKTSKLDNLKVSLTNQKASIDLLKGKIDLINNSKDIIDHNNLVEKNSADLKAFKTKSEIVAKNIASLNDNLLKILSNESKIETNSKIQEKIREFNDEVKAYKLSIYNFDNTLKNLFGEIKVLENNIAGCIEKLEEVKDVEKKYKLYSVYLQAMHKDGLPQVILRRKLPLINQRINTILSDVVEFSIDMTVQNNGDITETFKFSQDGSDSLPLSNGSGSQKFISSLVIKEALHSVSTLTKPSISIIDEGFGTLDNENIIGIESALNYLKMRHKNVLVISHTDAIKDFVDNSINIVKTTEGLLQEVIDKNPNAGVTHLSIS